MASTPAHGERHIAQLIDDRAAETPDRPCYSIANSPSDSTKGWRDISYGQVANAVNIAAQWLVDTFGRKGSGFEVFAYIGPNDLRYAVITLAAMKTGYQALMVSPRNPIEAQHSLFAATKAIALLYAESSKVWIDPIVAADKVATHVVPSEADWLDAAPAKHFPLELNVTVEELAMLPAYVLHTSGSTGIPKPVFIKHGWLMAMDRFQIIRTKSGQAPFSVLYKKDDRMFASMPLFHASGLTQALPIAIFYEVIITFGPPNVPISADTFDTAVQYSKANVTMLPPSVLEDLASDPTHLATLKKLDFIVTGGGPSSLKTAEKLMEANVKAFSLISATEGIIPLLEPDNADFPYFRIDDELAGIDWRKVESAEEEDLYEMWIRRLPDWRHQGHFFTFPGTTEYNTKDICQKVPGRPGLWRYYARSDDVVVFSNGEKLNPIDIEGAVTDHPKVKGALVVGQGHFQAGLFVEPRDELKDDVSRAAFIDEIWPTVDKQNQMTVTHGHVLKGLIRVTSPEKPFPRAGKGTIQRASANALYKKEIEQLYKDEKSDSSVSAVELDLSSEAALAGSLVEAFASILESRGDALQADTDIFTVGVDSLGVLTMARKIKAGIQSQGVSVNDKLVSPRTIYANSTPQKLARALFTGIKDASANGSKENSTENAAEDSTAELQKLVREYSTGIPTVFPKKATAKEEVVIITGTTGGLGPYLLAETLGRSVAHVFALNRDPTAEKRQHASQVAKGLTANLSKVTFLTTDLSRPDLGLTEDDFKLIKSRATRIVHNAWPVNFNLPLDSFVPSIKGVRNLIDLAAASEHIAHIAFVSTIGTAAAAASPVQESNLPLEAARMGYGESKSISASILDAAREKGLSNAVIRVGQIAGSKAEAGQWNRAEWFPTIIASSAGMGLLPSDIGPQGKRVDWLPIEAVAGTIIDISEAGADGYYHTLNPAVTTYSELLPAITKYFGDRVKVVSYREWCAELEKFSQTAKGDADIEKVPGVKLLEFYQGNLRDGEPQIFETVRTEEASKTLAASTPVNASLMENWLRQWKF